MKKLELEITDDNLYETIRNNVLERNDKLKILSKLINSIDNNITISIDGIWGCGKTFFVKQFIYMVNNYDKFKCEILDKQNEEIFKNIKDNNLIIYYNAWENDDHEDCLESLIYNILNEYSSWKEELIDFSELKKLIKPIVRRCINKASIGTLDINDFDKLNSFQDLASSIYTSEEKKKDFNKLINNILKDNRLILVIDELDRCKPSFAVNMLETIKHFYTNDKITTIVSTNNLALSHTIKKYYGSSFDGYGYLDKFYDFIISMDTPNLKNYLNRQLDFCNTTYAYHDFSYLVIKYLNFSLRDCNKYITIYNMLKNYIEIDPLFNKEGHYLLTCIILPFAIGLKIKDIVKYNMFINNKGDYVLKEYINYILLDNKNERWFRELIHYKDDDLIKYIIDNYHNIFISDKYNNLHLFFEEISLLGNNVVIE